MLFLKNIKKDEQKLCDSRLKVKKDFMVENKNACRRTTFIKVCAVAIVRHGIVAIAGSQQGPSVAYNFINIISHSTKQ